VIAVTDSQQQFAARIVRRKKLFLALSVGGALVAFAYGAFALWQRFTAPDFLLGPRLVIVLLILLNSRQNLRQYRVAGILEEASFPASEARASA
jgi:hypothetical protein